MAKIHPAADRAATQMEDWCRDDSHGYDQIYRWGERGDYDCSAGVIQAYQNAGMPVKTLGATYTGNMRSVFRRAGFIEVPKSSINWSTGEGLLRGDVLLNEAHHTAMYCGNGKEAEFSINERGGATGGQPGDQTGREALIRSIRNYPWDVVLRLPADPSKPVEVISKGDGGTYKTDMVRKGDTGASVLLLQRLLRGMSYRDAENKVLERDGKFGETTDYALRKFQKKKNLEVDGICGPLTWKALLGL